MYYMESITKHLYEASVRELGRIIRLTFYSILIWILFWRISYYIFGIYVQRVWISNGLYLGGIIVEKNEVSINIKCLRLRFWGKNKVSIRGVEIIEHDNHKSKSYSPNSSNEFVDSIGESANVLPSNRILRGIVKILLQFVSLTQVDVRYFEYSSSSSSLRVNYSSILLTCSNADSKKSTKIVLQFGADDISGKVKKRSNHKPFEYSLYSLRIDLEFILRFDNGRLGNSKLSVFLLRPSANIDGILDEVKIDPAITGEKNPNIATSDSDKSALLLKIKSFVENSVDELSVRIEESLLDGLPYMRKATTDSLDTSHSLTSISLNFKLIYFNVHRLESSMAGYSSLFEKYDKAFEFSSCIQAFTVSLNTYTSKDCIFGRSTSEILNLPNLNHTFRSNIWRASNGEAVKDSTNEFFASVCNPVIDLTTQELSELCFTFSKLKRIRSSKDVVVAPSKTNELQNDETEDLSGSNLQGSDLKNCDDDIISKLLDIMSIYCPKIDLKFIVERPKVIIRTTQGRKDNRSVLMMGSFSSLVLHLSSANLDDYYMRCDVLQPRLSLQERNTVSKNISENIFDISSLLFNVTISKGLKVKALLNISGVTVDLSQFYIFLRLKYISDDLISLFSRTKSFENKNQNFKSELPTGRKKHVGIQPYFSTSLVIPRWLTEFHITCSNISFLIGSRSPLIHRSVFHSNEYSSDYKPSDSKMRHIRFKLGSIVCKLEDKFSDCSSDLSLLSESSETLASESLERSFTLGVLFSDLNISSFTDITNPAIVYDEIIHIPRVCLEVPISEKVSEKILHVTITSEKVLILLDSYKLSTLFGMLYLLREFLLNPFHKLKREVRDYPPGGMDLSSSYNSSHEKVDLLKLLDIEINIELFELRMLMNEASHCRLQLIEPRIHLSEKCFIFESIFARLLFKNANNRDWQRLLCLDSVHFQLSRSTKNIELEFENIMFVQPHRFLVHALFDNISITIKLVKFLVKSLSTDVESNDVYPSESKARNLPCITLKSKRLFYTMEDDPFESELSMIFQLGLVEQKKRLELISELEEFETNKDDSSKHEETNEPSHQGLEGLYFRFASSWIRKVDAYKSRLKAEIHTNKSYLYGKEVNLNSSLNAGIRTHLMQPPLLQLVVSGLDLMIGKTAFELDALPDFLESIGGGMPKDSKYSLLAPCNMTMKVESIRIHIRDYPLAFFHAPQNSSCDPIMTFEGPLVLAETMPHGYKNMRIIKMPLFPHLKDLSDSYTFLNLHKSLSTVKIFSEVRMKFSSEFPTRFVWGQSYSFALQRIMQNLDQFSKPPIDPSPKLGFWDKMRLIFHCKLFIESCSNNAIEIAFKGSRSPYDLFETGSGFILSFQNNIRWNVNEENNSKSIFSLKADKVLWYIPNYLNEPLISWIRDSSKSILAENSPYLDFGFGYYLKQDIKKVPYHFHMGKCNEISKSVVTLRNVQFGLGFVLERSLDLDEASDHNRPHYEIELFNPKFVDSNHDSYKGFRSEYLHMNISLTADGTSDYNSIHLSPKVFKQLFSWWKLFAGNMMLPVNRGLLFGEKKVSPKFSQHLYSNRFHFNVNSLFLAHLLRENSLITDSDNVNCIGLKARVDNFCVDLHQRKEPRVEVIDSSDQNKQILKMNFHLGEVSVSKIDLRVIFASFKNCVEKSLDSEPQSIWYDFQDYVEPGTISLEKRIPTIVHHPLLFSERFSYIRETGELPSSSSLKKVYDGENKNNCGLRERIAQNHTKIHLEQRVEELKNKLCTSSAADAKNLQKSISTIQKEIDLEEKRSYERVDDSSSNVSSTNFHNKFEVLCMFLTWNTHNRDILIKYLHTVQMNRAMMGFLTHKALHSIENILKRELNITKSDNISTLASIHGSLASNLSRNTCSGVSTRDIEDDEKFLYTCSEQQSILEDYLIVVKYPQIQLQESDSSRSSILISLPSLDSKIVSVIEKSSDNDSGNSKELEVRYGVRMNDASIWVIFKESTDKWFFNFRKASISSSKHHWTPWFGVEVCIDSKVVDSEHLIVDKCKMNLNYTQIKANSTLELLASEKKELVNKRFNIWVPKIVLNVTSKQYHALSSAIFNLLLYVEPGNKELRRQFEKLKLSTDMQDLNLLYKRIEKTQSNNHMVNELLKKYEFQDSLLSEKDHQTYMHLKKLKLNTETELYLLMTSIFNGEIYRKKDSSEHSEWNIHAQEIILHILEDSRIPMLDVSLSDGKFNRIASEYGTNSNIVDVSMVKITNKLKNSHYPVLLGPANSTNCAENLISVSWKMNQPVGGIKIMEHLSTRSQPLKINIDEITGQKILNFILPQEENDISSLVYGIDQDNEDSESVISDDDQNTLDKIAEKKFGIIDTERFEKLNDKRHDDDLEQMVERSNKYTSIISFNLSPIQVSVSIKFKSGYKRLINVQDFTLVLPEFFLKNKVLSSLEILKLIKKVIIRTLLRNAGPLLKQKLKTRQRSSKYVE